MERYRALAALNIPIPADAFSHGQIKSKIWLADQFADWANKHLDTNQSYELSWYGSWVGIGPFFVLCRSGVGFSKINLFDLDKSSLSSAEKILNYWHCEGLSIHQFCVDVNEVKPQASSHQIFVNTSCEHMESDIWVRNIPGEAFVLLQSTDMEHAEHVNRPASLTDFLKQYDQYLKVLEATELSFSYPDKKFSRYMIFGKKLT